MTKEQAVVYLRFSGFSDEQIKAIEGAFTCETCEDAISKEAVFEQIGGWIASGEYEFTNATDYLSKRIKALPPVTPQPKTGHWIPSHIPESILDECSECGFSCGAFTFNYCPNCGAKMVDPQEESDKDADKECTYKETGCGSCKRQLDCPIEADKAESENKA